MMLALCLNLDDAKDRWTFTRENFARQNIHLQRLSAVVGKRLEFPRPDFDANAYRLWHGKKTIPGEVGCYLSHIRAMKLFLESQESLALICEDDVKPVDNLDEILASAMRYQDRWDILRLSGFHNAKPQSIKHLNHGYSLCINLRFLAGTGAYVINRKAAAILSQRLLPMFLPYDHALDREWEWGLRSCCIDPLPIDQGDHEFVTQIETSNSKTAWYRRYWTVLPFRVQTQLMRFVFRSKEIAKQRIRDVVEPSMTGRGYRPKSAAACLTMNKA